jgi:YVTN family beta-propeller protein
MGVVMGVRLILRALSLAAVFVFSGLLLPAKSFAAQSYLAYVSNEESGSVSVIDGKTLKVISTIAVGKRPRGIRASPDGKLIYVALSGSPVARPKGDEKSLPPADKALDGIGIIDVAEGKLRQVFHSVSDPEQVAISPDGKKLYVASEDTGAAMVIDAQSGAVLAHVGVGGEPEGIRVSPDGQLVAVTSERDSTVAIVDSASYQVLGKIPVGERPRDVLFSPDSKRAYVSGEADASLTLIDVAAQSAVSKVNVEAAGARPMGLALSPEGSQLYLTTGRGGAVVKLDAKNLAPVITTKVGERPWGVALSPDGDVCFVANGLSNTVSVLRADKLETITTIPVGGRPWGIAMVAVP